MITCNSTAGDTFCIEGLTISDFELIQEAIARLFNESNRDEHRQFRRQVLSINRAIDSAFDFDKKKHQK